MGEKEDLTCIMSESVNNDVQKAYNRWAESYDTNDNKTRDTEAVALRDLLSDNHFNRCLEIGCGTGKNTLFLGERAEVVTAVDFSEEMLAKAQGKNLHGCITFIKADINEPWYFAPGVYDLVTFSLVLEHIEDINSIFQKAGAVTKSGSLVYMGELHPFKQYIGTKARFVNGNDTEILTCFNHNVSDFVTAAFTNGFVLEVMKEYFDPDSEISVPRILAMLFRRT